MSNFTIPQEWVNEINRRMNDPEDIGKYVVVAREYTGTGNVALNRYLREQDTFTTDAERDSHSQQFFSQKGVNSDKIWNLYNSLIDLRVTPPTQNVVLYRGVPTSILEPLNVGDEYFDAGFSSFSFSPSVAIGFASKSQNPKRILVLRNPQEGVWFGNVLKSEYEFVVGPRAEFIVTLIEPRTYGTTAVIAYEIAFSGYRHY